MPIDLYFEEKLKQKRGYKIIVGLDEVGRGPLAGPITVGAFVFSREINNYLNNDKNNYFNFLKDSKLLSAKKRKELYDYFCELKEMGEVNFSTASVFPSTIDKKHIHHAAALAMRRAVAKLNAKPDYALIDGFRYPGKILKDIEYSAMPKADNFVPSVAAASIVAKVKRDASMVRYHKKYPRYRFDLHKGYGTELHYNMLKKYGPSPVHRKSFRLS